MHILVIGGTRFMGPRVIRRLTEAGHEVTAFHRGPSTDTVPSSVRHIFGDRRSIQEHARSLFADNPDVVLDMVLITEAEAKDLVAVSTGSAARIVAASSCDVYRNYGRLNGTEHGDPDPVPLTEDSPLRDRLYPYRGETPRASDDPSVLMDDYDKILVEQALNAQSDCPATILRLPMVYGPSDFQHRVGHYLKQMDEGVATITLAQTESEFRGARSHVENAAAAIALCILDPRAAGRTYNVCDTPTLDEATWVNAIGRSAGWNGNIAIVPDAEAASDDTTDYRHHLDIDSSRIRRELGFTQPVALEDALRDTIAWERAQAN